jgi:hypothetical protein
MFKPKGENEIRSEVIEDLRGENEDFNEEYYQDTIDRFTQRRLKDEETKASLHKQKTKRREMLEANGIDLETGKPKNAPEPKSAQPGKDQDDIPLTDQARFFGAGGSRKELSFIRKVMKADDCDFDAAWRSDLFRVLKAENDKKRESAEAQLEPSRGGSTKEPEKNEFFDKFSKDLPPGFSAERPKAN